MIHCTQCGSSSTWPDEKAGVGFCNACRAQFSFAVRKEAQPQAAPALLAVERDERGKARRIVVRIRYGRALAILSILPVAVVVFVLSVFIGGMMRTGFDAAEIPALLIPTAMLVFFGGGALYLALDTTTVEIASGVLRATTGPIPRTTHVEVAVASVAVLAVEARMHAVDYVSLLNKDNPRLPGARGHLVARLHDGSQVDVANFANAKTAELVRSEIAAALGLA